MPGTEVDRRTAIDRRLDETFGTFDAKVRETQSDIARQRADQAAAGAAASAGQGGDGAGGDGKDGSSAAGGSKGGSHTRGGLESTKGSGTASQGEGQEAGEGSQQQGQSQGQGSQGGAGGGAGRGSGPRDIPPDVPDGSDDDVVARQIREAAMKETDPELRAALWEEYRKYKKGK
jgi:hypothetical protein